MANGHWQNLKYSFENLKFSIPSVFLGTEWVYQNAKLKFFENGPKLSISQVVPGGKNIQRKKSSQIGKVLEIMWNFKILYSPQYS